ncbi:hypothetical protein Gotur_003601 [Gossypium turneri]
MSTSAVEVSGEKVKVR